MKYKRGFWSAALSIFLCAVCIVPFLYVLAAGFQDPQGRFSLKYYYTVFLGQSQYLFRFWKSIGLSFIIAAGQVVISVLAGYSFAKHSFPGKAALFFTLTILMILPLQVTLMPGHIVMEKLGILDTYAALILPGVILPLGTFIMTQSFRSVPNSVIEAAKLDGCRLPGLLARIVVPMSRNALICTFLLSFLDAWNMVEQPITYLSKHEDLPLAVALASVPPGDPTVLLVCCVLAALPPLFLFAFFNQELAEGIALGGEK